MKGLASEPARLARREAPGLNQINLLKASQAEGSQTPERNCGVKMEEC